MKKVLIASILCGGLMVGCSHETDKISFEQSIEMQELQETIKEQEQYIAELEKYKQEQENFERQARQMQKQLDYEEEQANKEKYYIALTDVTLVSKNLDNETSFHFDYGSNYLINMKEMYTNDNDSFYFDIRANHINSGETFKMSEKDLEYFFIYGEYEEIVINEN